MTTVPVPLPTLVKLGSVAEHATELFGNPTVSAAIASTNGFSFDQVAIERLLSDYDVKTLLEQLRVQGHLPPKRNEK